MMNALARSSGAAIPSTTVGSFTSGASVGGGSNAGSVSASIPSPELRSSPQQLQTHANPASSLSPSDWSFPVGGGESGLGLSAATAEGVGGGGGGGNSSSGSTPRLGAEGDGVVLAPATARVLSSANVGADVSSINLAGDDEVKSCASVSSGAAAAGGEGSSEGGGAAGAAADTRKGGSVSPPADMWVASALSNAEDIVDGADGIP